MWFALWYGTFDKPTDDGRTDYVSCHHMSPYGRNGFTGDLESLPESIRIHAGFDREHAGTLRCSCCGVAILGEDADFDRAKTPPGATLRESYPVAIEDLGPGAGELVARVEEGERVTLTRHGRPVADVAARRPRAQERPALHLLADLEELASLAQELDDVPR